MEIIRLTQTPREGSIKRKSIHATCNEKVIKALRAAKALDPSAHLGDTQARLNVETKEEDVVMKTDGHEEPRRMK